MRFSLPLRMSVIKRGEKEQKLAAFVGSHFARGLDSHLAGAREILVIARSIDSPVAKALATQAGQIAASGRPLRIILARADRGSLPAGWSLGEGGQIECDIRWASNPRLLEAHEQLVLATDTCWIGDSMRRDPAKCDAYETYVEDNAEIATSARVSFERLWAVSQRLLPCVLVPPQPTEPASQSLRGR
jgi:hypothetical protein